MKSYTDIVILLDRSGSMGKIKANMEEALNSFIDTHKAVPSTKVTLIEFSSTDPQRVAFQSVPVTAVEPITINPNGGTPLLDALCKAIDTTGARYASQPESQRPDQVLFVIITDGEENASKMFTRKDVFSRITTQSSTYKWQFVYLGANQDAIREAASFGIQPSFAMMYETSQGGIRGMGQSVNSNTLSYAIRSSDTVKGFTNDQRNESVKGA